MVAISSGAGRLGLYGTTAYAPARFAVRGLMEHLRTELVPAGVHVACVFPPDVDTRQMAEENRYEPAESFAISGSTKPITAERLAAAIVRAIDHRSYAVYANHSIAALATLGPLTAPLVRRIIDRQVRNARRSRDSRGPS
ncbi:SDR family NAD(P)-dependent oxidoreductase [Kribbella antibiotica]|uniref:SDR family NAD(P)-dependent oxidoreductase n=1 Tax=Kribbella antibiotica TaxID=190195 RepID=A0A4R4ZWY5_9ACTN|nr:SDR family NAD(P)-dependent oxidoreductase [Kribbella antibiotica]